MLIQFLLFPHAICIIFHFLFHINCSDSRDFALCLHAAPYICEISHCAMFHKPCPNVCSCATILYLYYLTCLFVKCDSHNCTGACCVSVASDNVTHLSLHVQLIFAGIRLLFYCLYMSSMFPGTCLSWSPLYNSAQFIVLMAQGLNFSISVLWFSILFVSPQSTLYIGQVVFTKLCVCLHVWGKGTLGSAVSTASAYL